MEIIKKHKGLPKNYEGKYEQWAKANGKHFSKPTVSQLGIKDSLPAAEEPTKPPGGAAHLKSLLAFGLTKDPVPIAQYAQCSRG